jgi:hypothetical protein
METVLVLLRAAVCHMLQSRSSASEEGLSPSQSSDYEDQEDLESVHHTTTVHSVCYEMWYDIYHYNILVQLDRFKRTYCLHLEHRNEWS